MVIKLIFRPNYLPVTALSPPRFSPKCLSISLFSGNAARTVVAASSAADNHSLPYGPSLAKGLNSSSISINSPLDHSPLKDTNEKALFDEESFTRVFDIAALRVPSEHCFSLENRIRGHLLNWPRIRNIARVPGDEIEEDFQRLFDGNCSNPNTSDIDSDVSVALNRRIYGKADGDGEALSPVLYRDMLARTFNSKGFVKFRNLAKISRPKKRKRKAVEKKGEERRGIARNEMAVVEVVEEEDGGDAGNLSGLLGDEFKGTRWRGSTRLLLLDERYAFKGTEGMPEAIKTVFREFDGDNRASSVELVKCKLTLFYSYWQMNEVLESILPKGMIIPSAFETVGHIAHLNLLEEHLPYKEIIAKVVLDKNKPKIQTVVNKVDIIQNDYRTMPLEVLAGNHSLVTTVVENGLHLQVDLGTVYWSSRLATERQRLLNCFTHGDVVCDVFAGVGPIALSAAKKVKYVYANDLNPYAVEYMERNCVLNKLERRIEVFNMDGRRFIDALFANQKVRPITQVVMNLPNSAADFLDAFRGIFRRNNKDKGSILPKIHVYGFSKAQDPEFDFHERIRIALCEVAFEVEMRKVRLVAPGKWMLCASFILPERVAYAKTETVL